MTPRNAYLIQPRDSMYPPDDQPFNLPHKPRFREPESWLESLWFLIPTGFAIGVLYVARAFGWPG